MTAGDFDMLVVKYFAGELDRVERRELDRLLEADGELAARFDAAYDERTEALGLGALAARAPELDECFSPETLERFVAGELDPEAAAWVEAHRVCPLCRIQVEGLRASGPAGAVPAGDDGSKTSSGAEVIFGPWLFRAATGLAAAAAIGLMWPLVTELVDPPPVGVPVGVETPGWRAPDLRGMDRVAVTFVAPQGYTSLNADFELGEARGPRPAVRVASKVDEDVYWALATATSTGEMDWVHPRPEAPGLSPNMALLSPSEVAEVSLSLSTDAEVWVIVSPKKYNLDFVAPVTPALRKWSFRGTVDAAAGHWRVEVP